MVAPCLFFLDHATATTTSRLKTALHQLLARLAPALARLAPASALFPRSLRTLRMQLDQLQCLSLRCRVLVTRTLQIQAVSPTAQPCSHRAFSLPATLGLAFTTRIALTTPTMCTLAQDPAIVMMMKSHTMPPQAVLQGQLAQERVPFQQIRQTPQ